MEEARARDAALAEQARAAAPLRRALARIAGRIVAGRVWDRLGYARLGDYARERAGLTGSVLRELARVDSDLCRLPQTEAAFAAGELSWTKTRLIGRAAEPAEEGVWLAAARRLTAEALAREVRAARERRLAESGRALGGGAAVGEEERDEDGRLEEPYEKVELRCTAAVRAQLARVRWLARRAAGEPLPPWGCMEKMAAEVASALPPDPDLVERFEVSVGAPDAPDAGTPADAAAGTGGASGSEAPISCHEVSGAAAGGSRSDEQRLERATKRRLQRGAAAGGVRSDAQGACPPPSSEDGPDEGEGAFDPRSLRMASDFLGTPLSVGSSWIFAVPGDGSLPARRTSRGTDVSVPSGNGCEHSPLDDGCSSKPCELKPTADPRIGAARSQAPPAFIAALLDGLDDAGDADLDARLRRAVGLEQRWMAEVGAVLAALAAERGYADLGYRSLDHYVRERLGMAPSRARALLRIERTCTASAGFRSAWRSGRLTWNQALALVPVAGLPRAQRWMSAWVERADRVTLRRLEDDVEHAVEGERFDPAELPALPAAPAGLQNGDGPEGEVGSEAARVFTNDSMTGPRSPGPGEVGSEAARVFASRVAHRVLLRTCFWAPRDAAALFRAVLATVQRRVERAEGSGESESKALGLMCRHALDEWSRHETPRLRREHAVLSRDSYRCTMPGCTSYRNLQAHHLEYRSLGGSNDLENQTALCASHHHRDVHGNGRVRVRGRAPLGLRFDLPVGSWRSGDIRIDRAPVQAAAQRCEPDSTSVEDAQDRRCSESPGGIVHAYGFSCG